MLVLLQPVPAYGAIEKYLGQIASGPEEEADLERFRDARPALPREGRIVGTVGRLVPQKGLRDLIAAAPLIAVRNPDVRFVVVGDGPLRAELEASAGGRFLFTGWRDDVPELLASFDVYALPSHFEGLCYA